MPHLKELHARYADQGLVLIGVHSTKGGEKMRAYVEEQEIRWPVCIDVDGQTVGAFHVDSYPDYYLIDRAGRLRFADLANSEVDRAIETLLAEKPGAGAGPGAGLVADWPRGTYAYLRDGDAVGTWTFGHALARHGDRPAVRLSDLLEVEFQGAQVSYEVESLCASDPLLSPIHVQGQVREGEEATAFEVRFGAGKISARFGEKEVELELPERTVLDMALFRLATRMPFEQGAEQRFRVFELEDMALRGEQVLTCAGRHTLRLEGVELKAWKMERSRGERADMTLWVSDARRLLHVDWDGGKSLVPLSKGR